MMDTEQFFFKKQRETRAGTHLGKHLGKHLGRLLRCQSRIAVLTAVILTTAVLIAAGLLAGGCSPNHPPVITSLEINPDRITPVDSCIITCTASDEDGDELSYEWWATRGEITGGMSSVAWTAPDTPGIYHIMVTVSDGREGEAIESVTVNVKDNHQPTIETLVANKDWVTPSGSCRIECRAEDPDDDELTYEWWFEGGDVAGSGPVITWTAPEEDGLYDITVVVSDGFGGEATTWLTMSVASTPPPVIEALIVTPEDPEHFKEHEGGYMILRNRSCEIRCVVRDPGEGLTYEWSDGHDTYVEPSDCDSCSSFEGEGSVVTWTAPDERGTITITVVVYDTAGNMAARNTQFKVETCKCAFK